MGRCKEPSSITKWLQHNLFSRPQLKRSSSGPCPSEPIQPSHYNSAAAQYDASVPDSHSTPDLFYAPDEPNQRLPRPLEPAYHPFLQQQQQEGDLPLPNHHKAVNKSHVLSMSAPPNVPRPEPSYKKGFKLQAKRPFFLRRGTSSRSDCTQSAINNNNNNTAHREERAASPPPSNYSMPQQDSAVQSTSHLPEPPSASSSSDATQQQSQNSTIKFDDDNINDGTPAKSPGATTAYAGSPSITTPTPMGGVKGRLAGAPISSLNFVQTLNSLVLEPASQTLVQLAPPSVLAIPWLQSPYGRNSPAAPSSTSLSSSTYVSQGSSEFMPISLGQQLQQAYGCNEQLAASALSLPSVSVAAIWRALIVLQWINDNSDAYCQAAATPEPKSYMTAKDHDPSLGDAVEGAEPPLWTTSPGEPSTFEIGGLLQNVMDVLSSASAQHGVELVLYHGHDPTHEPTLPGEFRPEGGLRELHCKGDDAGLSAAIMAVSCFLLLEC